MSNIEFVHGQESHTSSYAKFYVKGLNKWKVKEDFDGERNDNHHTYNGYVCNDVPEGTLFTVFVQSGDKRGIEDYRFYICEATDAEVGEILSEYYKSPTFCRGNFRIVASGLTKTKAPQLMGWWIDSPNQSIEFARHCAAHIDKRGIKTLPPLN